MTTGPISREDDMNNIAILLLSDMTDNSTIGTVDLSFAHPLSNLVCTPLTFEQNIV
jgi:hypothetical protein